MKKCLLCCAAALVFVTLFLPAGCAGPSAQKTVREPAVINENCIPAQAVVHYFLEKDRHYFTQQQHLFCPDQKSLTIDSLEPQGRFQWKLAADQYSAGKAPEKPDKSDAYWNQALVSASYYLMTFGGEFLTFAGSSGTEPVKIEGQYYLELTPQENLKSLRIYRNQSSGKIDLIQVEDKNGTLWMAKSYNWTYYAPTGKLIPRKIDFFDISHGVSSKKLQIRTDYVIIQ